MPNQSVHDWLDDLRLVGDDITRIVHAVRSEAANTFGSVTEEIKYGGILFSADGVRFGGVFAYRQHVTVEFGYGASIDDPFGWLEGAGKGRRHMKFRSVDDIANKRLSEYMKLAHAAASFHAGR